MTLFRKASHAETADTFAPHIVADVEGRPMAHIIVRWILIVLVGVALIVIPFLMFEPEVTALWHHLFAAVQANRTMTAMLVSTALATDIVLPIPSSAISMVAGGALGIAVGTLAIWFGMSAGCVAGYLLGYNAGYPLVRRVVGNHNTLAAQRLLAGRGGTTLIVSRAVPVAAELMVLAAGAARMPFGMFLLLTGAANFAVALAYAAVGAAVVAASSFVALFLGLALIPAIAWWTWSKFE